MCTSLSPDCRGEFVLIDDEDSTGLHVGQIHLQRRGIHRHQDVGGVAGRVDLVIGEEELKAAYPPQRTRRGRISEG